VVPWRLRRLVKSATRLLGVDTPPPITADDLVGQYLAGGRVPWSKGYDVYRNGELARVVHDATLLATFRERGQLPPAYGLGLDERIVEYPWALSRLADGPERLLDAGSTLNYPYLLDLPIVANKTIVILTLATSHLEARPNVSYLFDDLRQTLLRDAIFDTIVCISTLEHVGLDNTRLYTADGRYAERDLTGFKPAILELRRMLAPSGRLLLTVPFGRPEDHGWLQQFDLAGLDRIARAFGAEPTERTFFRYTLNGWQHVDPTDCAACAYFDVHTGGAPASDGAAAARAVACQIFVRPPDDHLL
jgi:hypothetical protein